MKFILASASPRRSELLKNAGFDFQIIPAVGEERADGLPEEIPKILAFNKAKEIFDKYRRPTLAADTVVVFEGKVFGKPYSAEHAKTMLKTLSGKTHNVISGICFMLEGGCRNETVCTEVTFNQLGDAFIEEYVASRKPLDKAGAYGIQDGGIVKSYKGSYTNIVGLPMERVTEILKEI